MNCPGSGQPPKSIAWDSRSIPAGPHACPVCGALVDLDGYWRTVAHAVAVKPKTRRAQG